MRSSVLDILPARVKKSLETLGSDIAIARRKRGFTVGTMAERTGVSKNTYLRAENGDPTVTLGVYAMTLFILGFGDAFSHVIEPARDELGLTLDQQRLPKRVRMKKARAAP
jgi:transcriptional regulator with XRE-family HTH domain